MDPLSSDKSGSNSPRIASRRLISSTHMGSPQPPHVPTLSTNGLSSQPPTHPLYSTNRNSSIVSLGSPRNSIVSLDDYIKTRTNSLTSNNSTIDSLAHNPATSAGGIANNYNVVAAAPSAVISNINSSFTQCLNQSHSHSTIYSSGSEESDQRQYVAFKEDFSFIPNQSLPYQGKDAHTSSINNEIKKRAKSAPSPRAVMLLKKKNQFSKDIQFELMQKSRDADLGYLDCLPSHYQPQNQPPYLIPDFDKDTRITPNSNMQHSLISRLNKKWNKPIKIASPVSTQQKSRKRFYRDIDEDSFDDEEITEEEDDIDSSGVKLKGLSAFINSGLSQMHLPNIKNYAPEKNDDDQLINSSKPQQSINFRPILQPKKSIHINSMEQNQFKAEPVISHTKNPPTSALNIAKENTLASQSSSSSSSSPPPHINQDRAIVNCKE